MTEASSSPISAFNSPLETGLRSLYILTSDIEKSYDLQQLLAFDHFVVHTGDFEGAPNSLHPSVPSRNGELIIRRNLVEQGLLLMESKNLIKRLATSEGFSYQAEEFSVVLLERFSSPYLTKLRHRSDWVVRYYSNLGDNVFKVVFEKAFDRWASEFQFKQSGFLN